MYSFYGGRPGNSFVITKSYDSYQQMVEDFTSSNCLVHYDEYVLINTHGRDNPDGGKLYRRAYGNTADTCAEYIGIIAGPAGPAPNLQLGNWTEVASNSDEQKVSGEFTLVPGRDLQNGNIVYNDKIQWCCYTEQEENHASSTAHVGLKIPYPVIDFDVKSTSPYTGGNALIDPLNITKIDGQKHPFYQKWEIGIPKGIKGDSLESIELEGNTIYGTYRSYDFSQEGTTRREQIGTVAINTDYTGINSITEDDYIITINYGNDQTVAIPKGKTGSYINNFQYEKDNSTNIGYFTITQNQISSQSEQPYQWQCSPSLVENVFYENNILKQKLANSAISENIVQLKNLTHLELTNSSVSNKQDILATWNNNGSAQTIGTIENYITKTKIENNHLKIKYVNSNEWIDIGAFPSPYAFHSQEITPIHWTGTGVLVKDGDNVINLIFSIPINKIIPEETELTLTGGRLISDNSFVSDIVNLESFECNIEANVAGLLFIFSFTNSDLGITQENNLENGTYFLNLQISDLSLNSTVWTEQEIASEENEFSEDDTSNSSDDIEDEVVEEEDSSDDDIIDEEESEEEPEEIIDDEISNG